MDSDVFWSTLVVLFIVLPLVMIWAFAIVDLFMRHDLGGGMKILWFFFILFLPILGTIVYYLVRPPALPAELTGQAQAEPVVVAEKLTLLTELRDGGQISPEEYSRQRNRLLSA